MVDPAAKAKVQRMRDGYEESLRGIIREGIHATEFRDLNVKLGARDHLLPQLDGPMVASGGPGFGRNHSL